MEELTPITRKETFLAKAAGQEVATPAPVTREEVFLDAIAKGGGSGGGGMMVVNVINGVCDKTAGEIWAAIQSGPVCVKELDEAVTIVYGFTSAAYDSETGYDFSFDGVAVHADTAADYPSYETFLEG